MKMLKLFFVTICMATFISCNSKNEYNVTCYLPDASTNGSYAKFITKFGVGENGIPIDPDSLLIIYDNIQKKIAGGVGVTGVLTIEKEFVEFTPGITSSLMSTDIKAIKIPISEIIDVRSESFLIVTRMVIISTTNGNINFQPENKKSLTPFQSFADDICDDIRKNLKKS